MPLEIFPQSVALFPNDRQLFTARATYPPPLSRIRFNFAGLVQPDYSIRSSSLAGGVSGEGAFQLVGGVGSVEWTLTASSVPVSPSTVLFKAFLRRLDGVTTFWEYRVLISSSNIVITDELFGTLATLTITPVVGMKIRIEMASGFSLFIDGVLVHSRTTFASAIAYPAIYNFSLSGADPFVVTGPPRIPAPKLSGDWQLSPTDSFGDPMATFTNPAHGSLSNGASALEKIYSGGTVPGQYVVRAQINPGSEIWVEDAAPAGAAVVTSGGVWAWGSGSPTPFSGSNRLKSPAAVGNARYTFTGATTTLQINKGDVLTCHVFIDAGDPVTEIMLQWNPTSEANLFNHRAYWGANSIALGVDGTPSRRFMGSLPPTGVWTRLEVPASLVDLEGRVLNGMAFDVFDGIGSFDQAGEIPGIQLAEALINIPPLQILGALVRTLQPSAKARFQTNYDVAQTANLVTWSAVSGGGSFSQGEFTAPTAPGTTVVRATASVGNQVADLTINVPAVITPNFFAAAPLEEINWDTNIVSPVWTASAGSINSGTGLWTAPSGLGQTVKITATDGTFTVTRDVLILEKFPIDPSAPIQWERRKTVLISRAEDRSRVARVKDKGGLAFEAFEVTFKNKEVADLATAHDFWDRHYPSKRFIFEDKVRGIRKIVYFNSDISHEIESSCAVTFSFRLIEA